MLRNFAVVFAAIMIDLLHEKQQPIDITMNDPRRSILGVFLRLQRLRCLGLNSLKLGENRRPNALNRRHAGTS